MKRILAALLLFALGTGAFAQGSIRLQQRNDAGGIAVDDITSYTISKTNYNELQFDFIGDSRTANLYVSGALGSVGGLSGLHWFNQANALANNRYLLGLNQGQSGCRTDQYLQDSNFAPLLTSTSLWVVFNFPVVNDLAAAGTGCTIQPGGGAFPYTNTNGISVTQTTVGQVAADNLITRIRQIIALGKNAIVIEEPGAVGLTTASVTQQYDFNARMRAFCAATPRCFFVSMNSAVLSPLASSTLDVFQAGVLLDNATHYSVLGGYQQALIFNTWFQNLVPGNANLLYANLTDNNTTNPRQLTQNGLFQTQTGGTNNAGTCGLIGNVPGSWTLICGAGTTTVTLTYVADPSGFPGSCVQLAMTTAGADTVRLQSNAIGTSTWNLTDWFQSSVVVSIANGSSNLKVYGGTQIATSTGTRNAWANYGGDVPTGGGLNAGPTTAYTYTLLSPPTQVVAGSTSKTSAVGPQIYHQFTAAGSATSTVCRPSFQRLYLYSSAGFSGQ